MDENIHYWAVKVDIKELIMVHIIAGWLVFCVMFVVICT